MVVVTPHGLPPGGTDPLWFKRAIFYEIHIRGFFDGNDDGSGDFRGLTEKLDYLQWLGIDCIWLLPFYDSPLRDGGYDISDYRGINPEYGTEAEAIDFVAQRRVGHVEIFCCLSPVPLSSLQSLSDPIGFGFTSWCPLLGLCRGQ